MGGKSSQSDVIETTNVTFQNNNGDAGGGDGGGGNSLAKNVNLNESSIGNIDSSTTTYSTITDFGAIRSGESIARDSIASNEKFGIETLTSNTKLADLSIDAVLSANKDANDISRHAVDLAASGNREFLGESSSLAQKFGGMVEGVYDTTLGALGAAFDSSMKTARDATSSVESAYSGANKSILDLSRQSNSNISAAYSTANKLASDTVNRVNAESIAGWRDLFGASNNMISKTIDNTLSLVANNNANSINAVVDANKSEGERTTDTLIKFAMGGVAIVAAVAVWRN